MKREKDQKHKQVAKKLLLKSGKDAEQERWKYYSALGIIVLISFFVYLPVLQNGFLWDDNFYIISNPLIRSINMTDIFSQNVGGNYLPLTILTLAVEFHFFGLNETGYHAVNLLLHLLNVILVFYTVFLLCDKAGVALIASLLFGIHPIHVESVAWAAELKDLLYTFFFLASYIFYLKYLKDLKTKYYVLVLLLFLLSLLSKAMAASLPVVFILTDYFLGRKFNIRTWLEKVPFILLAIALGMIAVYAQRSSDAIQDLTYTFPQRIVFVCYSFVTYMSKLLLPVHLCAFYPYPAKIDNAIPVQYYAYILFFLGIVAYVLYSLRFSKKIIFGMGFFTITIFLVLQLLPVGGAIMADRYSYVPSIGIFYLAGEGLNLLWMKKFKLISITLLTSFTLFFSITTYSRSQIWNNRMVFWNDMISQYQTIPNAYYNRGVVFMEEKRDEEALIDFNKTIELKPDFVQAYINRGIIFMNKKRNDEAMTDFKKAIELNPGFFLAYYNLGIVFYNEKKYEEAISNYSKAIALKSDYAQAYYSRGLAEYYTGKKEEACLDLKQAASFGFQPPAEALQQICN